MTLCLQWCQWQLQYIPRIQHPVSCGLVSFIFTQIFQGHFTGIWAIVLVLVKQPWSIWVNKPSELLGAIICPQQNKPCAYFIGIYCLPWCYQISLGPLRQPYGNGGMHGIYIITCCYISSILCIWWHEHNMEYSICHKICTWFCCGLYNKLI